MAAKKMERVCPVTLVSGVPEKSDRYAMLKPCQVRWIGTEEGHAPEENWST